MKALRVFAENRRDDAFLGSLGGSMRVTLRRSEHGSLQGEAFFQHGPSSQTVSFSLWDASLQAAVAQAEIALERVLAADHLGWIPDPNFLERMPHVTDPQPPEMPRAFPAWDAGLGEGEDVTFDYEVDGYGWYAITVKVGDKTGETGGSYLTDSKGDLIRAALAMLAGADKAEVTFRGEPGHVVLELQRVNLRSDEATEVGLPGRSYFGCWVRIRDLYDNPVGGGTLEFEALCRSPRAVAEAIYRMALAHFEGGAGFWSPAMASLEGALKTVPRQPGE
ncbi:MAG: hypothetical protein EOP61_26965 [Sphingomonadales bacterium]|nr:MAG: hypothetical protein EOP61_26965 [Sphingomonadales bacterium]